MNDAELISKLAGNRAAHGSIEVRDVADWVLADLRRGVQPPDRRVWQVAATVGCALAIVIGVFAVGEWDSLTNPLSDLGASPLAMEVR